MVKRIDLSYPLMPTVHMSFVSSTDTAQISQGSGQNLSESVATFWEIAAHSVDHMFSLYFK